MIFFDNRPLDYLKDLPDEGEEGYDSERYDSFFNARNRLREDTPPEIVEVFLDQCESQLACSPHSEDNKIRDTISTYCSRLGLILPDVGVTYKFGANYADYLEVRVANKPVLVILLPPWTEYNPEVNFTIRETEHTRKLLKSSLETANAELAIAV